MKIDAEERTHKNIYIHKGLQRKTRIWTKKLHTHYETYVVIDLRWQPDYKYRCPKIRETG
jgi:hypothetical protein